MTNLQNSSTFIMENDFYKLCKETKIIECLTCGKKLSGVNAHNMKRHYKLMHHMDIPYGRRRRKFNDKSEVVYETQHEEFNINEIYQQIKIEHSEPNINYTIATENTNEPSINYTVPTENATESSVKYVIQTENITEPNTRYVTPTVHTAAELHTTSVEKMETVYAKRILEMKDSEKYIKHNEVNKTECLVCGRLLSGLSTSNIKRHFHLVHNFEFETKSRKQHLADTTAIVTNEDNSLESVESYSTKRPKLNDDSMSLNHVSSNIDCNRFLKCCIGLVAVKGISASIFDDDDFFKTLIAPQEEKFGTNLSSDDISTLLQRSNLTARDVIISKMKNKIVSLKMDLATGTSSKVLNISVQYIEHFKICHNTLDIIQLDKSTNDIRDTVLNCLENYEINKDQVYCYMTEVTTNVGKVKDHKDNIDEPTKEIVSETRNKINNAKEIFTNLATELHEVKSANNIIQLTVFEVLSEIDTNINQYRILVKKLQTMFDDYQDGFILDNATNWLSTYKMLESLLNNKTYLEEEGASKIESLENQLDWNFITDLITALTPLVNLSKQLYNEQYIFGDFYRDWLSCEIELEELFATSTYARLFVQSMQKYKQELLSDEAFLSAIYLDPRFNFCNSVMLNEEQKRKAEAYLTKQHKIMHATFKNQTQSLLTKTNDSENSTPFLTTIKSKDEPSTSKNAYDKLTQRIMNLSANLNDIDEPQRNFKQKLLLLLSTKMMVPLDTNVLDYWKNTNCDPDITAILEAALAVPVTQVTIGRAANALWYSNEDVIDRDLLLTKYNFKEINENYVEF